MTENTKNVTGNISIHTENILPIIKKWLYSENEIFIRELVSNAFDAISKYHHIASVDSVKNQPEEGKIAVSVDKDKKTITISDNGLGMDSEEVEKYINQIAFSGAEDFIKQYKDKDENSQIIGHFGLGFYSSFIVSDTVEINSLSYKEGAKAVRWTCDGSTEYTLSDSDKTTIGTDIILHVSDESKSYLDNSKITELVKKYANFLPVEIKVNEDVVNDKNPLWMKKPTEVSEENYKDFYQKLFPYNQEPHFWIHLNVDYPFNLKGILYFPKLLHELDSNKGRIKLFCQQVFVTDDAKNVVPEFLTLLQGAIDCPDIPLNVSRSYLQNDPYVRKISQHIVKKVADKLKSLFKKDRENFEKYWIDINHFIKYGMMNDNDFFEKVKDIVVYEASNGSTTTIDEYLERNKDKNENKVIYATDKEAQASYISLCEQQGLEVIYLSSVIDTHFLQFLESKNQDIKFVAVDSELSDHLLDKSENQEEVDEEKKSLGDKIVETFKSALGKDKLTIKRESLKSADIPAMLLESEQTKRLKTMSAMMGNRDLPDFEDYTLIINEKNPIIQKISSLEERSEKDLASQLCEHVYDLSLLNQKQLKGDQLKHFLSRSNNLLEELSKRL